MNSSQGLEVPDHVDLNKIVADIRTPEPDLIADFDADHFEEDEN